MCINANHIRYHHQPHCHHVSLKHSSLKYSNCAKPHSEGTYCTFPLPPYQNTVAWGSNSGAPCDEGKDQDWGQPMRQSQSIALYKGMHMGIHGYTVYGAVYGSPWIYCIAGVCGSPWRGSLWESTDVKWGSMGVIWLNNVMTPRRGAWVTFHWKGNCNHSVIYGHDCGILHPAHTFSSHSTIS